VGGYVYLLASAPYGTLYVGVTNDLAFRVWQHREGQGSAFCRRYGVRRLVHYEIFEDIQNAIHREADQDLAATMEDQPDRRRQSPMG